MFQGKNFSYQEKARVLKKSIQKKKKNNSLFKMKVYLKQLGVI